MGQAHPLIAFRAISPPTAPIVSAPGVILPLMGYGVRRHSPRGNTRRGYHYRRATRPGRYTSLYVHGYRSASPIPMLWAFAVIAGGVVLLLSDPERVACAHHC
ncbi:hypothetical protein GCM10027262_22250 [Nocardia tengchongensis]